MKIKKECSHEVANIIDATINQFYDDRNFEIFKMRSVFDTKQMSYKSFKEDMVKQVKNTTINDLEKIKKNADRIINNLELRKS